MSQATARFRRVLDRLRNRPLLHDLGRYDAVVQRIAALGRELEPLADDTLRRRGAELRVRPTTADDPVDAFALAREAARRTVGMFPYEEQVLAALALDEGHVVEMQTGEGKTLAAVLPAFARALDGQGVHVLTFNDYLARRDATWMGPIYEFLGLTVGHVREGLSPDERRRAYAADVTYVTAKEAGFDFLRDCRACQPGDIVHRPLHQAIVDEADSLMVDEARSPLVLAADGRTREGSPRRMAALVRRLEPGRDYVLDDNGRNVELTDRGLDRASAALGCGDLIEARNLAALTELNCALFAEALLRCDVDYIVRNGRIRIVDEHTGRVARDRHWPDGLQAALEAKEDLARRADGTILGSITLQHFLRLYPRLCGMTGTALSATEELHEFYDVRVAEIPTRLPCRRRDLPDVLYTYDAAKLDGLVAEIRAEHDRGRPVLVGTGSVEESERLASRLTEAGVPHRVLNAKNDEREAAIVAEAGAPGAVTISTNMAGRGTDIRLGGADQTAREQVVALGGLYVIGTQRHESTRIDRQLRGRAGRQGDPGESRLFVSLEDDLVVRHGIDRVIPAKLVPERCPAALDNPVLRREVARVQRIVEGQNFDIRRALYRYSAQIEDQRIRVAERRRRLLDGSSPRRLATTDAETHDALCARVGRPVVEDVERRVTLFHLDRLWSLHLADLTDLRDGIHLERLGGRDPLTEFGLRAVDLYHELDRRLDEAVVRTMRTSRITADGIDLEREGLLGPSSTRTYMVHDDPFRDALGVQLLGPGNFGLAAAAALFTTAGPLLIGWGLYNRYVRRRAPRAVRQSEETGQERAREVP
ncbi:MAG: accessory Sec system translocase SecA2 [bacterium]|nr:accessory Sec system translocase SecA2 [bacterium]